MLVNRNPGPVFMKGHRLSQVLGLTKDSELRFFFSAKLIFSSPYLRSIAKTYDSPPTRLKVKTGLNFLVNTVKC